MSGGVDLPKTQRVILFQKRPEGMPTRGLFRAFRSAGAGHR